MMSSSAFSWAREMAGTMSLTRSTARMASLESGKRNFEDDPGLGRGCVTRLKD